MSEFAEDPRYAAYAYLLLRGRLRDAAEINLNLAVPICGEVFDRTYGVTDCQPGAKRQICVKPVGHPDRADAEMVLMTDFRPRHELRFIYQWRHMGWQITPITYDDWWGNYGYCSMMW